MNCSTFLGGKKKRKRERQKRMNAMRNIGIEARRITKKRDKRPRV